MLDAGRDPNHTFSDGSRPLHVVAASKSAKAEAIRLLVERGAQVDAKDGEGKTAWELRWGDPRRMLFEGDAAVLVALLDAGFVPPKEPIEGGLTLLHEVGRRVPSTRLVSQLVTKHGFAVDARDDNGWTPLHFAAHENNVPAATGLLEQGADANAETTKTVGQSSNRGGTEIVSWRYEAGTRPIDLFRNSKRGRGKADVRKVLEQYGGKKNPAVDNKSR